MKYLSILDTPGGGGDDNKLPPPQPKGYTPLSVSQRADWNGFLDYASKQNGVNLSDPKQQAGLLASYKKANPNFSITPDKIPAIQYEAYQLRKGDSFGNLNAKQLGYIRQGMNPNFLNADVSNVGKTYYPQMGNYGTDVENYYNAKFNPSAATAPSASPQAAAVSPKAVANTQTPGAIPLPNYDDPKSRAAYLQSVKQKYGEPLVQGRGDTVIHVNEIPDGGTMTAKDSAVEAAKKVGLDPALLYSSAMEEGMSGLFPDSKGNISTADGEPPNKKYQVDGFFNYGLDNFHDQFKTMVAKGYLPKDFDYLPHPTKNEKGEKVNSAYFKTPEDAMKAKAAYVKMEQDDVDDYAKKKGYNLSDKARQFFTLINFNGGEGTGHKMIDYYAKKGLLNGDKYLTTKPEPGQGLGQSWGNVTPRMEMADLLKKEGLFQ